MNQLDDLREGIKVRERRLKNKPEGGVAQAVQPVSPKSKSGFSYRGAVVDNVVTYWKREGA